MDKLSKVANIFDEFIITCFFYSHTENKTFDVTQKEIQSDINVILRRLK